MTQKEFCKIYNITEAQFFGKEKIEGDLDLNSVTTLIPGFNPNVGGDLYLRSSNKYIGSPVPPVNKNLFWDINGKKYCKIDGIFCQILNERVNKTYTVYSCQKVNKPDTFYIVKKDTFYAHGESIKKAYTDASFKAIAEKLKHKPITADTKLTVMYYRTITGACDLGCRGYMDKHKIPYTIEGDTTIEQTPIKAKDLMKLLDKDKPYGYERIKAWITF